MIKRSIIKENKRIAKSETGEMSQRLRTLAVCSPRVPWFNFQKTRGGS